MIGSDRVTEIVCSVVLGIRDILVRIRIRGSVPLPDGSGSALDPSSFFSVFF
jgi:hypothetical protein